MKIFYVLLISILIVNLSFAVRIGTLPELLKPEVMRVYQDELFVIQGASIFIYSLKDLTLKRKFAREGEGPGELKKVPNFSNNIIVYPGRIFVESIDKIVYFSRDGKFLYEKRKFPRSSRIMPVGENFVGKNRTEGEDNKIYTTLNIYTSGVEKRLEKKKELYRQKFPQQGISDVDIIPDSLNFWVHDNKIFVEESLKGFFIEVFDSEGEKLYEIKKDYKKIKITDAHKKDALERLKQDPLIKLQGWENIKRIFKFNFFDTFPAIKDIFVTENKIYIQTFNCESGKDEFVIMDLEGNLHKKIYLNPGHNPPVLVGMIGLGPKFYSIYKNKIYYLEEDEEEEMWELYVTNIK